MCFQINTSTVQTALSRRREIETFVGYLYVRKSLHRSFICRESTFVFHCMSSEVHRTLPVETSALSRFHIRLSYTVGVLCHMLPCDQRALCPPRTAVGSHATGEGRPLARRRHRHEPRRRPLRGPRPWHLRDVELERRRVLFDVHFRCHVRRSGSCHNRFVVTHSP